MMELQLDEWQKRVLAEKGNICLRSGRQVGKSTVIGIKAAKYALNHTDKLIMVIAKTERQAGLLFAKILGNIHSIAKSQIKRGKDRPTKHIIKLKNGSVIHCLPVGETGFGIMGFTIHLLIADEAAFIQEEVWNSIIPALAVTRGNIWLLSTPYRKQGYYYECFNDETFASFHQSAEDCPRRDDKFLAHKKATLTESQYSQMYLGEFVDQYQKFFPTELIKKCMTGSRKETRLGAREYYLGVDVARMGEDLTTFEIIDRTNKERLVHVESIITSKTLTTDTTKIILQLEDKYHFKQIFIDAFGVGTGVFDQLITTDETKRKTIAIDHWRRPLDKEEKKKTKITKEDIYNNLLMLMEQGKIQLLNDQEVLESLDSIQYDYNEGGKISITGEDAHVADGLVRAAWCSKDKSLNIYIL